MTLIAGDLKSSGVVKVLTIDELHYNKTANYVSTFTMDEFMLTPP